MEKEETLKAGAILLVEDVHPVRVAIEMMLGKLGIAVQTAANGQEALDFVHDREFALILMDVQMPEMDGIEATKSIRIFEQKEGRSRAVIVAISDTVPLYRDKCELAGMDDFFEKPMITEDLEVIIKKWAPVLLGAPSDFSESN